MSILVNTTKKVFERPKSGEYTAVIADAIDLGIVDYTFQGVTTKKAMVGLVFVLDKNDSEGNPYQIRPSYYSSMHEKAKLFKHTTAILGQAPPVPYDIENLVGHGCKLFVITEKTKAGNDFAKIVGITPLAPGVQPPKVPATFVRRKDQDRFKNQTQTQTQVQATPIAAVEEEIAW